MNGVRLARAAIATKHVAPDEILGGYHAANPRLFGSVARGDATSNSDVDLLVDLLRGGGNELLRVAGREPLALGATHIAEELSNVLGP